MRTLNSNWHRKSPRTEIPGVRDVTRYLLKMHEIEKLQGKELFDHFFGKYDPNDPSALHLHGPQGIRNKYDKRQRRKKRDRLRERTTRRSQYARSQSERRSLSNDEEKS